MILGNSNGNNKGKTYLKHKDQIDELYAQDAYSFEVWFNDNYNRLQNILIKDSIYKDDVFHDCFLSVRDQVLYKGLNIKCFDSYFIRTYYTNHFKSQSSNKDLELNENIQTETPVKELNYNCAVQVLFEYLDYKLEPKESELIKIYYINEMSIREISEHLKIKYYVARYILRKAKKKLQGDRKLIELINDSELTK